MENNLSSRSEPLRRIRTDRSGGTGQGGLLDQGDTRSESPSELDTPQLLLDDEFSLLREFVT